MPSISISLSQAEKPWPMVLKRRFDEELLEKGRVSALTSLVQRSEADIPETLRGPGKWLAGNTSLLKELLRRYMR
ncbi:MAG: hypothetical protein SWE60_11140 [Thermodesulfobacteriota bacterium]|nr:hypothetical protein [Thermodesulfobacteriota bacterium]